MPPIGIAAFGSFVTYKDFSVLLVATARLTNYGNNNQQPGVVVNYSHVRAAIKTNFTVGWTKDNENDPGFKAKISASLTTKVVDYSDGLSWDYAGDY